MFYVLHTGLGLLLHISNAGLICVVLFWSVWLSGVTRASIYPWPRCLSTWKHFPRSGFCVSLSGRQVWQDTPIGTPSYPGVSLWGRRDKEPSRTRYFLWFHPSYLFHPPSSVSLGESRESQAQWGRKLLLLSTIVGGSPDDCPLPVVLSSSDVRGTPTQFGGRISLPVGCYVRIKKCQDWGPFLLWIKRHKIPCLSVVPRVQASLLLLTIFQSFPLVVSCIISREALYLCLVGRSKETQIYVILPKPEISLKI